MSNDLNTTQPLSPLGNSSTLARALNDYVHGILRRTDPWVFDDDELVAEARAMLVDRLGTAVGVVFDDYVAARREVA